MNQYDIGINGESAAEQYLCRQGMMVIARRFRANGGEIDLILLDHNDVVVFVEVKSRPHSDAGEGLAAITPAKQRRITQAALSFLVEREWMDRFIRFDVVEINRRGILHIPNAFSVS